ncbi:hypothetical protein GCM10010411_72390 [Actinomadura fulvescens]|uniref:Uncharacterized protein n=1 Tax=Actinomadura fulvescens TaxID=46160 RepID=A0ABN3QG75_9ACTN
MEYLEAFYKAEFKTLVGFVMGVRLLYKARDAVQSAFTQALPTWDQIHVGQVAVARDRPMMRTIQSDKVWPGCAHHPDLIWLLRSSAVPGNGRPASVDREHLITGGDPCRHPGPRSVSIPMTTSAAAASSGRCPAISYWSWAIPSMPSAGLRRATCFVQRLTPAPILAEHPGPSRWTCREGEDRAAAVHEPAGRQLDPRRPPSRHGRPSRPPN